MELIYSGFDKLEIAFQGALPERERAILRDARELAAKNMRQTLISLGPGKVDMHVADHGLKGGYAFITDTGPTGEKWMIKDNGNAQQWNLAVSVHASSHAVYGFHAIRDRIWNILDAMGAIVQKESVRRVDYAMDFLAPDFELDLDQVVAHGHSKVVPYWGPAPLADPLDGLSSVTRGRRLESITVGKMPGRQMIMYDKRKAAIELRKLFWFKVWGIDPYDLSQKVWRVEFRAGKKELNNRWRIITLEDVENSIGDVFRQAALQTRYVDEAQTDTNITRQRLHPLWRAVSGHLEHSLMEFRSGLLPGQLIEIEREAAIENYMKSFRGNAAGLAAASGLTDADIENDLAEMIAKNVEDAIMSDDLKFWKSKKRAEDKYRFITGE